MKTYDQVLEQVRQSPASRVCQMTAELNPSTLEWDTTYTLILQNRHGKIIHHRIVARSLSVMLK